MRLTWKQWKLEGGDDPQNAMMARESFVVVVFSLSVYSLSHRKTKHSLCGIEFERRIDTNGRLVLFAFQQEMYAIQVGCDVAQKKLIRLT